MEVNPGHFVGRSQSSAIVGMAETIRSSLTENKLKVLRELNEERNFPQEMVYKKIN